MIRKRHIKLEYRKHILIEILHRKRDKVVKHHNPHFVVRFSPDIDKANETDALPVGAQVI